MLLVQKRNNLLVNMQIRWAHFVYLEFALGIETEIGWSLKPLLLHLTKTHEEHLIRQIRMILSYNY